MIDSFIFVYRTSILRGSRQEKLCLKGVPVPLSLNASLIFLIGEETLFGPLHAGLELIDIIYMADVLPEKYVTIGINMLLNDMCYGGYSQ